MHSRAEEEKRLASAEQRLYQQIAERTVSFDNGLHLGAWHSDDGTRLRDDERGVQPLAGKDVQLGDEVARAVDEEGTAATVVDVGTLDFSLEHDDQVVGQVAGGRQYLPNRRLLCHAIRPQRRELLVGQLGK